MLPSKKAKGYAETAVYLNFAIKMLMGEMIFPFIS
jgi:hypothetical protein